MGDGVSVWGTAVSFGPVACKEGTVTMLAGREKRMITECHVHPFALRLV